MSAENFFSRFPYLAPLASGSLLVFAYRPFSVPILPFFGLVPLFWFFSSPRSARQAVIGAWAFCVPYFVGNTYWLAYPAKIAFAASAGFVGALAMHWCSFFLFPIGMNVLNHKIRAPLILTAPLMWTLSEHARAQGPFNFPWVTLGYSLSERPLLVQHADVLGVYGVSWWLALINAVIVALLLRRGSRRATVVQAAVLAAALALPLAYNVVRWEQVDRRLDGAPTLKVAVVQPNIPQRLKWDRAAREANVARLNRFIAEAERLDPDLVIGPEACLPMIVSASDTRLPAEIPEGRHPLLLGVVRGVGELVEVEEGGVRGWRYRAHFNSAVLAAPDRTRLGAHDKHFLVPVSERIPYERLFKVFLPFMRKQFGRFVPAERLTLLDLTEIEPTARMGALICYESLFTGLIRRMSEQGATLLVLITNDAWFGRSSMPFQHVGLSVLRAIEARRSLVMSANTGISAFVDPLGRVRKQTPIFEEALFSEEVPLLSESTFYVGWGNLVVYACYAIAALLFGAAWRAHRRSHRSPTGSGGTESN